MDGKQPADHLPQDLAADQDRMKWIEEQVAQHAARKREKLIRAGAIGAEVRNRRIALGIAQEKLAHQAEVTLGTVSRIERGYPAPKALSKVLNALSRLERQKAGGSPRAPSKSK